MCGGRWKLVAISMPQVSFVFFVAIRINEKTEKRQGGGIEDMGHPAVALPLDEFLAQHSHCYQDKLQVEPIIVEPQEKVRAQDNRKCSEA